MHVTAVVVSHDGGNYLPRTLAALLDQTRPADAAIGIDTGSRDTSVVLLQRALGKANVISTSEHKTGFGAAVTAGLARLAPPSREPGTVEWIWLLHDDAAPAPDALAELLQAVERAPSVTVAGCKQLAWNAERRLIDAGLSTSRWAERLTLIEADELDQGQYDGRTDTFAVNSAGMLIRRDAWEQLGGFDPALPGVGDDVDFCWRNWLAGNRVVVVPAARMFHVENRPHALATPAAARKSQIHLRLTHASPWKVPLHAVGALLGSLVRLVLSILVKEPGHGISQLGATVAALARPGAIWRSRRNAARTRRVPRSMVKGLQTPRREVWAHRRSLVEAIGADEFPESDSLAQEPSGDAGDDFVALATNERVWIGTGAVAAGFIALAASIVGLLGLLGADGATGGGLLPLSAAGDIWRSASTWWIGLGAGLPGHGDPFAYILWFVSLLGGGDSGRAIVWLLLLAMPLSGLGAWFAAGAMTTLRRYRFIAALIWAGAPALEVAVNQGRVGALLAHVVMPLLVLALFRATGSALGRGTTLDQIQSSGRFAAKPLPGKPGVNGTPSWTAAAGAGLALAIVTASAPSLLPPFALLIIVCGIALGRRGRTIWWSLLPSAALLAPYVLSALERPRTMLADPGVPLGFDAAPLWQQLLGQPLKFDANGGLPGLALFGPSGIPWALALALLLGAPVLILSIASLIVPGNRSGVARFLWAGALLFLAWAWLAGHVATAADGNLLVTPFTGPAVSAAGFAFLGSALIGADNLLQLKAKTDDGRPVQRAAVRVVSAVATLLLIAGPLAGMGLWATQNVLAGGGNPPAASGALGTPRLVQPSGAGTLPATAVDHGQGPEQSRTLVITAGDNGGYTSSLMRGAGTTLDSLSTVAAGRSIVGSPGQERLTADDDATASIRKAVATIVAGTGVDPRPALEQLGAGFVVLKSADPAAQLTANRIDSVPGLVAVGKTDSGWLWRVTPLNRAAAADAETAHRVRVVDAKGAVVALLPSVGTSAAGNIPAGGDGRLVVLAERADAGWSAWLDGRPLNPTTSGWAQAFTLPPAGGQLEIRYTTVWEPWLSIVQAVVIGLTILLAIPMPARRPKAVLLKEQNSLRKEYSSV
ncbi:glycosyltransferase [Arthrobacter alkaliphilus]|uniref:glycosyltransferase family 2 protein n=1 Tax=Arthrobacter alkaliphilus TaxID=369936 RepID=UPI001F3288C3|nr:glycosyltransferase family 2 protein [Arthrobacter alkaliphilus]